MPKRSLSEPELWERQVGESSAAYEAFKEFRDMPGKRTGMAVSKKLGKSSDLIYRWKTRWYWEDRVRAYDNKIQRERLAQKIKERDEMYDRHENLSAGLQSLAAQALQIKLQHPEDLSVKDIGYLTKIATDLDRLSRNEQLSLERIKADDEQAGAEEIVIYVPDNGMGGNET